MKENVCLTLYAGNNLMITATGNGYENILTEAPLKTLVDEEITEWKEIKDSTEKNNYRIYLSLASKALRELADDIDKEIF